MTDTPLRIYVASLSDYNNGILHGVHIDLDEDTEIDEVWEQIRAMLKASPVTKKYGDIAEEWALHDSEGFHPWNHGEYESIENMVKAAHLIAKKGRAAAHWLSNDDSVLNDADDHDVEERFDECFRGEWDSEREYAENLIEDVGLPGIGPVKINVGPSWAPKEVDVLDKLGPYLDWDALTDWATQDMSVIEDGGKVYVFSSE